MIRIEFTGEAREVLRDMQAMVNGGEPIQRVSLAEKADEPEPAPKATRSRKKAEPASGNSTGPAPSADESTGSDNSPTSQPESDAPSTAGATSGTQAGDATVTRESLAPKCTTFSSKAGTVALQELFRKHGSATGKWSGVPDESLPALNVELDELLAG